MNPARLWIKADATAGTHVKDAAAAAIALAGRLDVGVEIVFNGITLHVVGTDTVDGVLREFDRGIPHARHRPAGAGAGAVRPGATPPPEPLPAEPGPVLAAGQVWGDTDDPNRGRCLARIDSISKFGDAVSFWLRYSDGTWKSYLLGWSMADFRERFRYPVSSAPDDTPAPEPSPAPPVAITPGPDAATTPSPVDLLAAGKRCRFVRDAGAIGEEFPATIDGKLIQVKEGVYVVGFAPAGYPIEPRCVELLICSDWNCTPNATAKYAPAAIARLGYRFDRIAE